MLVAGFGRLLSVTAARGIRCATGMTAETRETRPACAGRVSMRYEAADYEM